MSEYTKKLAGMKTAYDDSQNQYDSMFGGAKVPAGNYVAKLQSAVIKESQSSGKLMIAREHLITEGEFANITIYDNIMLETPMGFTFVRRWVDMMGYEQPEQPEEIEDIVSDIAEEAPVVKIRIKHSGDFVNVSVIEVLDGTGDEAGESDEQADETEETQDAPEYTNEALDKLREFCIKEEIELSDDDDEDSLKEKIDDFEYPEDKLDEWQIKLLTEIGQEANITRKEKPKPLPAAKKKTGKKVGKKK